MRPLTMKGVNETGMSIIWHNTTSAMAHLVQEWNVWETQVMVLVSLMLQLFLLPTGSLRQSNTRGLLKVLTWLSYLAADSVAFYALGLFSQYEDTYKSGRQPFGDTLPFLWIPFLLVHLGGQDSITAFSIEDNNLWLRHLLKLVVQGALALYVFSKSFYRISYSVLTPAMFMFVAGIIKYGERAWALKSASRDGLGNSIKFNSRGQNNQESTYPSQASYAHQTVLLARGLFVGRTVAQLGSGIHGKFKNDFMSNYRQGGEKLKIIMMELGMMFDLLYTKAVVLQRWSGVIFRFVAQILTVVAFVLFLNSEKHPHSRVNVEISYTLFVGAIFTEACSISAVIASPWTKAHSINGTLLHGIHSCARCLLKAIRCDKRHRTSCSMGQFNFMDYCISHKYSKPKTSKVISAIGLEKLWRNLWYVQHIDASEGIIWSVLDSVNRLADARTGNQLDVHYLDRNKLKYTLGLPYEHALYRLHVYTDLHISEHFATSSVDPSAPNVRRLKKECENLSNYMMYLMVVYPSMLPVSTAAEDLEPAFVKWLREDYHGEAIKLDILQAYAAGVLNNQLEQDSLSPFEPVQGEPFHFEESLKEIKEMWLRLLAHAAGKCRGELHARQLGNGGELITFVWLLMAHHGLGDVATELRLLIPDDRGAPEAPPLISVEESNWRLRQEQPRYAFDFRHPQQPSQQETGVSRERQQLLVRGMQHILPQVMSAGSTVADCAVSIGSLIQQFQSVEAEQDGATPLRRQHGVGTSGENEIMMQQIGPHIFLIRPVRREQDGAGTSGEAGQDDEAGTSEEITEEQGNRTEDAAN